jgi:hypothetical protein
MVAALASMFEDVGCMIMMSEMGNEKLLWASVIGPIKKNRCYVTSSHRILIQLSGNPCHSQGLTDWVYGNISQKYG